MQYTKLIDWSISDGLGAHIFGDLFIFTIYPQICFITYFSFLLTLITWIPLS